VNAGEYWILWGGKRSYAKDIHIFIPGYPQPKRGEKMQLLEIVMEMEGGG